jgi:PD-(D/E)XK nuclease superfamily
MPKKDRVTRMIDGMPGCSMEDICFMSEEELTIRARYGTAAHKLWHRSVSGPPIDWSQMPESPLTNYGRTFEKFRRDVRLQIIHAEKDLIGRDFGGRPDLICTDDNFSTWVIDAKTGKLCLRYEVQVAVYGMLAMEVLHLQPARYSILEVSEHRYRVRDIPLPRIRDHQEAFAARVKIRKWEESYA